MIGNKNPGGEVPHLEGFPTLDRDQPVPVKAAILDSSAQPVMGKARNNGNAVGLSPRKLRHKFPIKMVSVDVRNIDGIPSSREKFLVLETLEGREVIPGSQKGTVRHPRIAEDSRARL
jgi:hypothetical protein